MPLLNEAVKASWTALFMAALVLLGWLSRPIIAAKYPRVDDWMRKNKYRVLLVLCLLTLVEVIIRVLLSK